MRVVEGTDGLWCSSRSYSRAVGFGGPRAGDGEFYGERGPTDSAPHQIQDSVLDRSEEEVQRGGEGGGEEEGQCSDGRRFEKTNGQHLLAG